jgi:hypothetical protein
MKSRKKFKTALPDKVKQRTITVMVRQGLWIELPATTTKQEQQKRVEKYRAKLETPQYQVHNRHTKK